jgi:hypothetical protein
MKLDLTSQYVKKKKVGVVNNNRKREKENSRSQFEELSEDRATAIKWWAIPAYGSILTSAAGWMMVAYWSLSISFFHLSDDSYDYLLTLLALGIPGFSILGIIIGVKALRAMKRAGSKTHRNASLVGIALGALLIGSAVFLYVGIIIYEMMIGSWAQ